MSPISWIALVIVILLATGAVFVINKKSSKDAEGGFDCTSCTYRCGKEKGKRQETKKICSLPLLSLKKEKQKKQQKEQISFFLSSSYIFIYFSAKGEYSSTVWINNLDRLKKPQRQKEGIRHLFCCSKEE